MTGAPGSGSARAEATTLASLTTLRVGGSVADVVAATTETELVDAVREADDADHPLLVVGGGSNILAADAPFPGRVVRDQRRGLQVTGATGGGASVVTIPAGQPWDEVVTTAVAEGWVGIEALAGIPGSTGATPVQNVGAYGQEVAETLVSVRVYDRHTRRVRLLPAAELGLGYRTSVLKRSLTDPAAGGGRRWGPTGRYVVLEVALRLPHGSRSAPVRYAELARTLDVEVDGRVTLGELREAVLTLRRGKGMVLAAADHDTWSAGSFFTNPVLDQDRADALLPPDAPRFPVTDHGGPDGGPPPIVPGLVKSSAAWLISRAGFDKGFGLPGPAALSTKHTLAVTNRGTATAADVLALARVVRDGVQERFGIGLVPEPVLVGLSL